MRIRIYRVANELLVKAIFERDYAIVIEGLPETARFVGASDIFRGLFSFTPKSKAVNETDLKFVDESFEEVPMGGKIPVIYIGEASQL